jgi:transcriptional regulator with XRE-family HTH domain
MREQAGLTQQDLLAAIGSHSISRIWAWEAWERTPRPRTARDPHIMSLSTAASLSRALNVSLDEFWKGLDQAD